MYTFFDRTLGGRRDTQRSACDAPRKAASWYAADTYGNIRFVSPEGSVHAENHGNSTNNQVLRARTRALGVRLIPTPASDVRPELNLKRTHMGTSRRFGRIADLPALSSRPHPSTCASRNSLP